MTSAINAKRGVAPLAVLAVLLIVAYAALVWYRKQIGPALEYGAVKFALDHERALASAKLQNKPVLLYFTGVNTVNGRRLEEYVLSDPRLTPRLRRFVCVAVFVDQVPVVEGSKNAQLLEHNLKLQESFGDVTLPALAVVDPAIEITDDSERAFLGVSPGYERDVDRCARFLDYSWEKWLGSGKSDAHPPNTGK